MKSLYQIGRVFRSIDGEAYIVQAVTRHEVIFLHQRTGARIACDWAADEDSLNSLRPVDEYRHDVLDYYRTP